MYSHTHWPLLHYSHIFFTHSPVYVLHLFHNHSLTLNSPTFLFFLYWLNTESNSYTSNRMLITPHIHTSLTHSPLLTSFLTPHEEWVDDSPQGRHHHSELLLTHPPRGGMWHTGGSPYWKGWWTQCGPCGSWTRGSCAPHHHPPSAPHPHSYHSSSLSGQALPTARVRWGWSWRRGRWGWRGRSEQSGWGRESVGSEPSVGERGEGVRGVTIQTIGNTEGTIMRE